MMNSYDKRDNFAISYNPSAPFTGRDETAIVLENSDVQNPYFILMGDRTDEYENKSLKECLQYFIDHEDDLVRFWSNTAEVARQVLQGLA